MLSEGRLRGEEGMSSGSVPGMTNEGNQGNELIEVPGLVRAIRACSMYQDTRHK